MEVSTNPEIVKFFNEKCELNPQKEIRIVDLYQQYIEWYKQQNKSECENMKIFGSSLKFQKKRKTKGVYIIGIQFKDQNSQESDVIKIKNKNLEKSLSGCIRLKYKYYNPNQNSDDEENSEEENSEELISPVPSPVPSTAPSLDEYIPVLDDVVLVEPPKYISDPNAPRPKLKFVNSRDYPPVKNPHTREEYSWYTEIYRINQTVFKERLLALKDPEPPITQPHERGLWRSEKNDILKGLNTLESWFCSIDEPCPLDGRVSSDEDEVVLAEWFKRERCRLKEHHSAYCLQELTEHISWRQSYTEKFRKSVIWDNIWNFYKDISNG